MWTSLGQSSSPCGREAGLLFQKCWGRGVSVNWHQDCHYFGTASPKIISCGIYLEDTDEENGCLQVVPGSHTRDFEHRPGHGLHAQGEWATPGKGRPPIAFSHLCGLSQPLSFLARTPGHSDQVVDVVVPAGSVVLFNSRLCMGHDKTGTQLAQGTPCA